MLPSAVHHLWSFEAPILSLVLNRDEEWVALALADGTVHCLPADSGADTPKELATHAGISLSLAGDAESHAFLSGGDDGKLLLLDPVAGETIILAEHKNRWIDHVAGAADGKHRAYSVGKEVFVLDEEAKPSFPAPFMLPSSPGGLLFSPNGKRLAASHYNGATLWWMGAKEATPTKLEWKGSHLNLLWSPDGKVLMTAMQDDALHGWQVADGKEMRMQGYAAKVRSMAFTARGKYLATSGAEPIICWPFSGGGPWGKPPMTLGGTETVLVTYVAPHPVDEMIAAGYEDGRVALAPLDGRMEITIHPPSGAADRIVGLVWNGLGDTLFAAQESGRLLMFTIESVRKSVISEAK